MAVGKKERKFSIHCLPESHRGELERDAWVTQERSFADQSGESTTAKVFSMEIR